MARSAIIIALVLKHLLCQLLPKLDLGGRRTATRTRIRVVCVDLRQSKEESKLPVLPPLGPPSFI